MVTQALVFCITVIMGDHHIFPVQECCAIWRVYFLVFVNLDKGKSLTPSLGWSHIWIGSYPVSDSRVSVMGDTDVPCMGQACPKQCKERWCNTFWDPWLYFHNSWMCLTFPNKSANFWLPSCRVNPWSVWPRACWWARLMLEADLDVWSHPPPAFPFALVFDPALSCASKKLTQGKPQFCVSLVIWSGSVHG